MPKTTHKNIDAIPTWKIAEIVDSHHCVGVDGADYGAVEEELSSELWKRQNAQSERDLKHFEQQQKELFKFMAKSHKRTK